MVMQLKCVCILYYKYDPIDTQLIIGLEVSTFQKIKMNNLLKSPNLPTCLDIFFTMTNLDCLGIDHTYNTFIAR